MKHIPLTKGEVALVDDRDHARLSRRTWYCQTTKWGKYAARRLSLRAGGALVLMHRIIMRARPGDHVDHKNRNGLDNRRKNLRCCTERDNYRNRGKYRSKATSKFKGVSWDKNAGKWSAQITVNYVKQHLGLYEMAQDAAVAYDRMAKRRHKAFALTNKGLGLL